MPATVTSATAPTSARRTVVRASWRNRPRNAATPAARPRPTATTYSRPARLGITTISAIMAATTRASSRESRSLHAVYTPTATTVLLLPFVPLTRISRGSAQRERVDGQYDAAADGRAAARAGKPGEGGGGRTEPAGDGEPCPAWRHRGSSSPVADSVQGLDTGRLA